MKTNSVEKKLTKQDLRQVQFRHILGLQLGWNYERMQGLGYYYAILPALKKLYADDPEALHKAALTHLQFYNTQPGMSEIIIGMDVAIEEAEGIAAIDTVAALKTGMMGPFAGIGDVLFGVVAGTIFGAIAGNMAVEQSSTIGLWIWVVWNIVVIFLRQRMFHLGYKQGGILITSMKEQLDYVTNAASILGLIVVGALIPSNVKIKIPFVFTSGEVSVSIQDSLNSIMPYIPQIVMVYLCYRISRIKGMTTAKLILIVMVAAIALSALGVISN